MYNLNGYSLPDGIFGVFNALGTVAFAYGGHNVILEIQVCFQHHTLQSDLHYSFSAGLLVWYVHLLRNLLFCF